MTVTIRFREIVTAISQININGVNVKDLDSIPVDAKDYCPVLYPIPNDFLTEPTLTVETLGGDDARALNFAYTLNYRYLHAPLGSGSVLDNYSGMVEKLALILKAFASESVFDEAIDVEVAGISNIGPGTDPAGQTQYHGFEIALRVLEYIQ